MELRMGFMDLADASLDMFRLRNFSAIMNRNGKRRPPCLNPHERENNPEMSPLISTELWEK